jgi:hypothetical protein
MVRCSLESSTRWDKNIFGGLKIEITRGQKLEKNGSFSAYIFHEFWRWGSYASKSEQQICFIIPGVF